MVPSETRVLELPGASLALSSADAPLPVPPRLKNAAGGAARRRRVGRPLRAGRCGGQGAGVIVGQQWWARGGSNRPGDRQEGLCTSPHTWSGPAEATLRPCSLALHCIAAASCGGGCWGTGAIERAVGGAWGVGGC